MRLNPTRLVWIVAGLTSIEFLGGVALALHARQWFAFWVWTCAVLLVFPLAALVETVKSAGTQ